MRRRIVLGIAGLAATAAGTVAIAGAQEESGDGASDIPKGPSVDFCPTPEQTEAHLKIYGFDYKPTLTCLRDGEAPPPTPEQQADTASDPDAGLSPADRLARLKQELLDSKPASTEDGDPLTLEGVNADGERFQLEIQGDPETFRGMTPEEFAKMLP